MIENNKFQDLSQSSHNHRPITSPLLIYTKINEILSNMSYHSLLFKIRILKKRRGKKGYLIA